MSMEGDFSQRMGFRPMKPNVQLNDINDDLLTSLWSVFTADFLNGYRPKVGSNYHHVKGSNRHLFATRYYFAFRKTAIDKIPVAWSDFVSQLRKDYFNYPWHRVYSFLEFVLSDVDQSIATRLSSDFNAVLEREGSGFRVVDGYVCPITSAEEMGAVEEALAAGSAYAGVSEHLSAAVRMLSDKQNPDYRNSIKESISAVESIARHVTGDSSATLGQAIKVLERKHQLHQGLKTAFSALYGYTNDADGIRHSLMDDGKTLTSADARFMLITCSAFVSFVIDALRD
jgi:hypothetical protein